MLRLADVVAHHGSAYLARHRGAMLPSHVRALSAITRCRTPALGAHLAECGQCGCEHLLFHSCRHRACPRCGRDTTERWLARQRDLLLPVKYFHVVFTLPSELRRLVRSHQRALIGVLFRAAFDALAQLCRDERYLGGRIGAIAVLHTWTRTLGYHPHIHMLVPGGALAPDGTWRTLPRRRKLYLVPVEPLGMLFAGKFLAAARRALPEDVDIPDVAVGTKWVVFAKPAVQGRHAVLRYISRYIHKTAIVDGAIERCTDKAVTFRYRDSTTHERKRMTLASHEFLRRFLQHTLPKGLHRVRAFGLLSTTARTTLRHLQLLLGAAADPDDLEDHPALAKPRRRCPHCNQGSLLLTRRLDPEQCAAWQTPIAKAARAPPTTTQMGALAS